MTKKFLIGAGLLAAAASLGCNEPKNRCKVAPGLGIARYTQKSTTGDCTNVPMPAVGEAVGMAAFVPDPNDPAAPDTPTSLSIKPMWLGERISEARDKAAQDPALMSVQSDLLNYPYGSEKPPSAKDLKTTKRPYAFGKFESVFPDDDGVCQAGDLNASDLTYPAIPAHSEPDPSDGTKTVMVPELPATSVKYVWKNVRTIQIPQSPGTQTFAEVTIARDTCTVVYTAAILVPRVSCGKDDGGTTVADQSLCDPNPSKDPKSPNIFGSGISQGVPTKCLDVSSDPKSPDFVCVPTKTKP